MKKSAIFLILMLPASLASFAQGNGMAGISEATNMVTSYFDPLTKLIFAVAAVLGLVGGVRVYSKFNSGDPDASKSATALFLSCVFLVTSAPSYAPSSSDMAQYTIHKGVDRQVEFQGLTSHYLILFVAGLLGIFLLFVILYAGGVPQGICILFAVAGGSGLTWATFYLNRRFGPHGLMKLLALRQHPRRIIHRRSVRRLLERRTLPKR